MSASPKRPQRIEPTPIDSGALENLRYIRSTIEAKACFFPRPVVGQPVFKFLIASELRYRYRTTYIHAPDIVRLNRDDW